MSEMDAAAGRLEARVGRRFVEVLREFVEWHTRGRRRDPKTCLMGGAAQAALCPSDSAWGTAP